MLDAVAASSVEGHERAKVAVPLGQVQLRVQKTAAAAAAAAAAAEATWHQGLIQTSSRA
jgi:hypothetical protein